MEDGGGKHILTINASLIKGARDEMARTAWTNIVNRGVLFDEIRDKNGETVRYGLRSERLAAIVANESTPGERAALLQLLSESQQQTDRAIRKHGVEIGADGVCRIDKTLPFVLAAGDFRKLFHRLALRAAATGARAGVEGANSISEELRQAISSDGDGWDKEDADLWVESLDAVQHSKNWIGTTVLTYSPENGMISAIPHKGERGNPLTAHETHVVPQDGGRRVLGVFAGRPDCEAFRRAVAESYLETYLERDGLSEREARAFEGSAGRGRMAGHEGTGEIGAELAGELLDGIRRGDNAMLEQAWNIFRGHYQDKTDFPLQIGGAVNGGLHLGVLPPSTLGKIFSKLGGWNDGGTVMSIVPEGAEADGIVERYGRMWTTERREKRLDIVSLSDRKFKEGSVGFIRVMRGEFLGATQSGEDPGERKIAAMLGPEAAHFDGSTLDKLDRLLGEIESKYGRAEDRGPASLPELCDRFLSAERPGARDPWRKQYRSLEAAYKRYKSSKGESGQVGGIAASEFLYDAMADFMVSRFGVTDGREGGSLRAAAKSLISSAAKTGYLYLITDPAGNAVKIGITNNLPERLDALSRENGPMCLVACYAFKSIPVSSWDTRILTDSVEGKDRDAYGALTGLYGEESRRAREKARGRLAAMRDAFGYGREGGGEVPEDFMVFCVQGMLSLCGAGEKREGGRGVPPETMADRLREIDGFDRELCGPLADLWGQYLQGGEDGTSPAYQRATLKALNRVILTIAAGGEKGSSLAAEAEKESFGLLGREASDRDRLYKYGSQLGPAVCEAAAHRLFSFARRDKGEFFFLGDNFGQILETMAGIAGGGEVHNYLLAEGPLNECGGMGAEARKMRADINTAIKPDMTLSWSPGGTDMQTRIFGLWETARKISRKDREAQAGTKTKSRDREGRGAGDSELPVHLQVANILAGRGNAKAKKVETVAESVRELLGLDKAVFASKLRAQAVDTGRCTDYKPEHLREKIISAARQTFEETRKGAGEDIPSDELVEFLSSPGGTVRAESRAAVRQRVADMKFGGGEAGNPLALKLALGSGLGSLGGYPVTGGEDARSEWRKTVANFAKGVPVSTGGFHGQSVMVAPKDILLAADDLDRELRDGDPSNARVLETYGAVVCGTLPEAMRKNSAEKTASPRGGTGAAMRGAKAGFSVGR